MRIHNVFKIVVAALLTMVSAIGTAQPGIKGNSDSHDIRPIIYEDSWDLGPYAFINDEGEPDGFNVDLFTMMCRKLNIPYIIRLKNSADVISDIKNGKADLTFGMYAPFHDHVGQYGKSVLCLFTHSVLAPKSSNLNINSFNSLKDKRLIVHNGSFSHHKMVELGIHQNMIPFEDMKDAAVRVSAQDSGMVLWNTMCLKFIQRKCHLDNLKLYPVNMEHGEYRFISNDSVLLSKLDSLFTELQNNEELNAINKKWFYPDNENNKEFSNYVWSAAYIMLAIALVILLYTLWYRAKKRMLKRMLNTQNARLALYLNSGNTYLWRYDVANDIFLLFSKDNKPNRIVSPDGFAAYFDSNDYQLIDEAIKDIIAGKDKARIMSVKCHKIGVTNSIHFFNLKIMVLREENGKPMMLLGIQQNITEHIRKHINTRNLLLKYRYVFNTAMADMIYYDANGKLIDLNDRACETFGVTNKHALCSNNDISVFEFNLFKEIIESGEDSIWVTSLLNFDIIDNFPSISHLMKRRGKVYYEIRFLPIIGDNGEVACYFAVGNDISDMVKQIREEEQRTKEIERASAEIKKYIESINSTLEECDMQVAIYDPHTHEATITYDMHKQPAVFTQQKCLRLISPEYRHRIGRVFELMDRRINKPMHIMLHTTIRTKEGKGKYYNINVVPMLKDKKSHYFCLIRDVSKEKEYDMKLEMETRKAEEAETLKNSFLKNMSYEIRTPLNAVVGFSELYDSPHAKEDEPLFAQQIKENTDLLLRLVNDILFLSRIDANMVTINNKPTEMVAVFTTNCQLGMEKMLKPKVNTRIESRYKSLMLNTDAEHIGFIINTFARLAALFTHEGEIIMRLGFHNGNLAMIFDDTGVGMDKDSLHNLFSRDFNSRKDTPNDTDLKLLICNELVNMMGGRIDVESSIGKGTTIWVNIPCELVEDNNIITE